MYKFKSFSGFILTWMSYVLTLSYVFESLCVCVCTICLSVCLSVCLFVWLYCLSVCPIRLFLTSPFPLRVVSEEVFKCQADNKTRIIIIFLHRKSYPSFLNFLKEILWNSFIFIVDNNDLKRSKFLSVRNWLVFCFSGIYFEAFKKRF